MCRRGRREQRRVLLARSLHTRRLWQWQTRTADLPRCGTGSAPGEATLRAPRRRKTLQDRSEARASGQSAVRGSIGPWSPRLDCVRAGLRNRLSEEKDHTAEASARRGSGVLPGRCVRYPPNSTPLLLPDGIVFTELVNSRIVSYSEVVLGRN